MTNLLQYRPTNSDLLTDRVILITGATSGIGRAVALLAAQHGAQLVLHGRKKRALEALFDEVQERGAPDPALVDLDLKKAQGDQYQALINEVEHRFGRLDGLLHNAAILGDRTPIDQYDIGLWQEVIHVNLNTVFILTRCLMPLLKQSKDGTLLFTTSTVGHEGRAFWGAYAVSKFGVEGLFQVLANELGADSNIRANCINPGGTRTGMRRAAYPAEGAEQLLTPEDLAWAYLYLLGPDSRGINGELFEPQKA